MRRPRVVPTSRLALLALLLAAAPALSAQSWIDDYFNRVDRMQTEQPHWITPLVTTTSRLDEKIRYDISWQLRGDGTVTENYGGGKGVEVIPVNNLSVVLPLPPYIVHSNPRQMDGWGDASFQVKYRLASRNEEGGNYVMTAFLGWSIPTGSHQNGAPYAVLTPMLGFGKGWGKFDIQTTAGIGLPIANSSRIGQPVAWNLAAQYRILKIVSPQLEMNYVYFHSGPNDGRTQVFLTPGVVAGRFPLWRRLSLTVGAGVQIAATQFHTYNHAWILSTRLPF
jgi:hypothetical protein